MICNDANVSTLPLSLEDEHVEDMGTQVSQGTNITVDSINDRIQAIMSDFFIRDKIDLLTQPQLDALDKAVKVFGRTTKSIFNPRVTPKAISLPRAGTNISSIQAHVTRTRFGHGRPWRGEDTMVTMEEDMTQPSTTTEISTQGIPRPKSTREKHQRQYVALKRKRIQFPKGFKQKCRVCGDYNIILSSYDSTSCRNCASQVTRGELEFGTIGIDGSLVGKLVEIFNDETNKWYIGRLSCYNHCKEGDYPQSYSIELQHNGNVIRGITFPDENIRFA